MGIKEARIFIAVIIIILIIVIILACFIVMLARHQKKYRRLYKENLKVEITTLENERKRIAKDLHDDFGPVLSSIKMRVATLDVPQHELDTVAGIEEMIDENMRKVRAIANNLMPSALEHKGLIEALRLLCWNISEISRIEIDFRCENYDPVSKEAEVHIYRIAQEILNNALKYSKATKIVFRIESFPAGIKMAIRDNGSGFDQKQVEAYSEGLGLKNIKSRIEILNGTIFPETSIGKGVLYNIEIPLQ